MASFQVDILSSILSGSLPILQNETLPIHTRTSIAKAMAVILPTKSRASVNSDDDLDDPEEFTDRQMAHVPYVSREAAFNKFSACEKNLENLVRGILNVFADCKKAGEQDVTQSRRPLYKFFHYFNKNEVCSQALTKIASEARDYDNSKELPLFLRFQTDLLQDVNKFIDEGLQALKSIREIEDWIPTQQESDEDRSARQKQKDQHTGMARWCLPNAKLCLDLIRKLTVNSKMVPVFIQGKIDRLQIVAMLNNFIEKLVGDKRNEYRLRHLDFKEVKFDPKNMICSICTIFSHFITKNEDHELKMLFVTDVVTDHANFKIETFKRARALFTRLSKELGLPDQNITSFNTAYDLIYQNQSITLSEDEIDLDDAPEEFLDPLTYTLISDPVELPTSHKIMDREAAVQMIRTNPIDPFNRQPLEISNLIPRPDIKEKIDIWVANQKSSKK